jgi:hypothetical protein
VTNHDYLLAELRCALARAKLAALDIECVGLALKNNVISPEQACELLDAADCLGYVGPQSVEPQ